MTVTNLFEKHLPWTYYVPGPGLDEYDRIPTLYTVVAFVHKFVAATVESHLVNSAW